MEFQMLYKEDFPKRQPVRLKSVGKIIGQWGRSLVSGEGPASTKSPTNFISGDNIIYCLIYMSAEIGGARPAGGRGTPRRVG